MDITNNIFRSTYTTPTFVQPVHGSIVSPAGDTLLEVYSPNGRFIMKLGDLVFPSATKVIIPGGLPLAYSGCPTCESEYHYTKIYAVYETYSQSQKKMYTALKVIVNGVTYEARDGNLVTLF